MLNEKTILRTCKTVKIAICDDARECVNSLKNEIELICAKMDWKAEIESFYSPYSLLGTDLSACQVLFLDIDMPHLNGIETARQLRSKYKELIIIFVTAYIEYAPAGYNVEAFRYLLKQNFKHELPKVMDDLVNKIGASNETILLESKEGNQLVPVESILYLEGTAYRKVIVHTEGQSQIEVYGKLSDYEDRLKAKGFLRLQRSYLANMAKISRISNYQVALKDGTILKASESCYKQVQTAFLQWKGRHL